VLYTDKKSSFERQLFYGRELCLLVFEVLFFATMDLIVQNYVFDAAMLYVFMQVCTLYGCADKNGGARNGPCKECVCL